MSHVGAAILKVFDAFDSMSELKPRYKAKITAEEAFAYSQV